MSRRRLVQFAAALSLLTAPAMAGEVVTVYKSPTCGCCQGWADYLKEKGFETRVVPTENLEGVKAHFHVPANMGSCHTAVIDGYVVEGHVPAEAIQKLLAEHPKVTGIAAPGMPQGSPGMSGQKEPYEVYSFGPDGEKPFMKVE